MAFINGKIPVHAVAKELGLSFSGNGHLHCWFPERHNNNDRTASAGIQELRLARVSGPFRRCNLAHLVAARAQEALISWRK